MALKSNNVEFSHSYWIEKFLSVSIFKMATTIPHKFNIVRFQRPELIPDIEKFIMMSRIDPATDNRFKK
jgi:hypothetical protein